MSRKKKSRSIPPPSGRAVGVSNTEIRRHLIALGHDPETIPQESFRMVRPNEAMRILGIAKTSFYKRVAEGAFELKPL